MSVRVNESGKNGHTFSVLDIKMFKPDRVDLNLRRNYFVDQTVLYNNGAFFSDSYFSEFTGIGIVELTYVMNYQIVHSIPA